MIKLFTSVKTTLWITGLGIATFLAGSYLIPQNLDIYSDINDMPLFTWMRLNRTHMGEIVWIYPLLGFMTLLAINMVVCGIEVFTRKVKLKGFIETASPQVLHLGVLFVLLGHLVSAESGYKQDVPLELHETREIQGRALRLDGIEFLHLYGEDSTRSRVSLALDGNTFVLGPAEPAFYRGTEYFIKSAQQGKNKAIIGLVYDPGVLFEIIGAIAFVIGSAGLFSMQSARR